MRPIGACRGVAGCGGGLRVGDGLNWNPTNGRQDKSAASGRAHVVGWIGDFRHPEHRACWRSRLKSLQFQQCDRRRPLWRGCHSA
jgi:hypothetical protein